MRSPAESSATSSSLTIFTTCWPAVRLSRISCADGPLADAGDEVLDDLEVDVGLEQGEADLAHGGIDVGLADPAAAGQVAERLAQPLAEGVEHGPGTDSVKVVDRFAARVGRPAADPGGARVLTHRGGRSVAQGPRGRRWADGPGRCRGAPVPGARAYAPPSCATRSRPRSGATPPSSASGAAATISIFGSLVTRIALPLGRDPGARLRRDRGRGPARPRARRDARRSGSSPARGSTGSAVGRS